MNCRVAIVLSSNMEVAPYYFYYTDCFEKINVAYDIISWDRLNLGTEMKYCFKYPSPQNLSYIRKLYDFVRYSYYVKKVLSSLDYDYVVVFTIANSIFLSSFLIRKFRNKFIIDIRDYSPIFPFTRTRLMRTFKNARMIYISSVGFKKWLPKNFNYVISHNVRLKALISKYPVKQIKNKHPLIVSTFGSIRDYGTNQKLIDILGHSDRYILEFNGSGSEHLEKYSKQKNLNIRFGGRYDMDEEQEIIERADIINILFPRTSVNYANLNNRFYHAMIHRKPVLVNEGSILAEYVKKYYLGLVLQSDDDIMAELNRYIDDFDLQSFEKGCKEMTDIVHIEVKKYEDTLKEIFVI